MPGIAAAGPGVAAICAAVWPPSVWASTATFAVWAVLAVFAVFAVFATFAVLASVATFAVFAVFALSAVNARLASGTMFCAKPGAVKATNSASIEITSAGVIRGLRGRNLCTTCSFRSLGTAET